MIDRFYILNDYKYIYKCSAMLLEDAYCCLLLIKIYIYNWNKSFKTLTKSQNADHKMQPSFHFTLQV